MDDHVSLRVECYSGHEYAERPTALYCGDQRLEIMKVEDGWRTPNGKAFRVRLEDGRACVLTYSATSDEWTADWIPEG